MLQGLGLSIDPGYSIVKECFPYLCRRLLTEDSPRMHRMLKSFLYGKDENLLQVQYFVFRIWSKNLRNEDQTVQV